QVDVRPVREAGPLTIMVGDGLNDAAAIAESRLGITMTSATDAARAASAVVITGDRVSSIADLIRLSRSSLRVIRQNLLFAVIYNAAAIPAAALGLLGEHGPLWAAAAMGLSDLTVIGNSLRLQRLLRQTDQHTAE
ncbi:MAG: heavy metal translocating P-type ATPase, partial [Planctomycetaceae bacterium]